MTDLSLAVRATFTDAGESFVVDTELSVATGETLVVLGPSGSGKTLLLEAVAGYHDHDGHVRVDGTDVTTAPPEDRAFGFVFQDYALFPHVTARENVAFGLRYHDGRAPETLLASLGVGDLSDRSPRTLSGGEKQRVALARALAIDPRVLLLDEPLSALDVPTRRSLRADLADVLADRTALYVTHDRATARALADRIAVMRDGTVVQTGSPAAVFEQPADAFVARFVGANVLEDGEGRFAIRPEHVRLGGDDRAAVVSRVHRADGVHRVVLDDGRATFDAFAADPPAVGSTVGVALPAAHRTPV